MNSPANKPAIIATARLTRIFTIGEISVTALRDVSLEIERGDFVAIMGPSGSGKSTLMNILGCLDRPTSGTYRLNNVAVEEMNRDRLAEVRNREIGFVFQQFNLLPRTSAIENVQLPLLYSAEPVTDAYARSLKALAAVGLADRADHHPNQLSGGQQQRVAIARALVNNPNIILADEPTGALDTRTSVEIMAIFQRLNREQGITTIIVTHEPDIAAYTNRKIYFRDGRIVRDEKIAQPLEAAHELLTRAAIQPR
ncbi:MAG: ABC transporter ATP-binding protein [Acidobacteriota bacterium]|nr:ABC transporter ATP-binding protein [Acidobacteriota bacterium]